MTNGTCGRTRALSEVLDQLEASAEGESIMVQEGLSVRAPEVRLPAASAKLLVPQLLKAAADLGELWTSE